MTDTDLLEKGYHWKMGIRKDNRRFAFAVPINPVPSSFHEIRVVPKFWIPCWLAVFVFRCFKVEYKVSHQAKLEVWLAD